MKKKLAVMALAAATLSMMAMPVYADDLVTVGYAQVGHESDWRTANTQNYQDVFSEDAGYSLDLVDCDNDNAAQLEAVRTFISKDMDYIVIAPIQSAGWDTVLQEAQDAGIPVTSQTVKSKQATIYMMHGLEQTQQTKVLQLVTG